MARSLQGAVYEAGGEGELEGIRDEGLLELMLENERARFEVSGSCRKSCAPSARLPSFRLTPLLHILPLPRFHHQAHTFDEFSFAH